MTLTPAIVCSRRPPLFLPRPNFNLIKLKSNEKKSFFFLPLFALSLLASAQKNKGELEIMPFARFDRYPEFKLPASTGPEPYLEAYRLKGISFGLNANYKTPLKKGFYAKAGIGYYRYSFTSIARDNRRATTDTRLIDFKPGRSNFIFYDTDKYWYNCVSGLLGIGKEVVLTARGLTAVADVNVTSYYTFSQSYNIGDHFDFPPRYKLSKGRFFGFSSFLTLSLVQQIGKFRIGPSLLVPAYDSWKQDDVFFNETNSLKRHKWFGGLGFGLCLNLAIGHNKKRV